MISDEFINVVRLPKQSYAKNTFAGKNVIATGYGSQSTALNFVVQTVITNSVCAATYGNVRVTPRVMCTAANLATGVCEVGLLYCNSSKLLIS